jgi:hypothetical protein
MGERLNYDIPVEKSEQRAIANDVVVWRFPDSSIPQKNSQQ